MTLPPAAGAALSLLPCTVGMFNATPRGHEADRYAHAMPAPGVVWQVASVLLKQTSFLVAPVIPSAVPRTWKVLAQGRQLGVAEAGQARNGTQPGFRVRWASSHTEHG